MYYPGSQTFHLHWTWTLRYLNHGSLSSTRPTCSCWAVQLAFSYFSSVVASRLGAVVKSQGQKQP